MRGPMHASGGDGIPYEWVLVMTMVMAKVWKRWERRTSNSIVRSIIYIVWGGKPGDVSIGEAKMRMGFV